VKWHPGWQKNFSRPSDKTQFANPCCSSLYMHETSEEEVTRLIRYTFRYQVY